MSSSSPRKDTISLVQGGWEMNGSSVLKCELRLSAHLPSTPRGWSPPTPQLLWGTSPPPAHQGHVYLIVTWLQLTVNKVNCFRQSPHLTQKASAPNLFFPITPVFHLSNIPFVVCLGMTWCSDDLCAGSFATHLPSFCLLAKTLLSQLRELLFSWAQSIFFLRTP